VRGVSRALPDLPTYISRPDPNVLRLSPGNLSRAERGRERRREERGFRDPLDGEVRNNFKALINRILLGRL